MKKLGETIIPIVAGGDQIPQKDLNEALVLIDALFQNIGGNLGRPTVFITPTPPPGATFMPDGAPFVYINPDLTLPLPFPYPLPLPGAGKPQAIVVITAKVEFFIRVQPGKFSK